MPIERIEGRMAGGYEHSVNFYYRILHSFFLM